MCAASANKPELAFNDVYKLNNYVDMQLLSFRYIEYAENARNVADYSRLCRYMLAKFMIFNRMRAGEAARILSNDCQFAEKVEECKIPKCLAIWLASLSDGQYVVSHKVQFRRKDKGLGLAAITPLMARMLDTLFKYRKLINMDFALLMFANPRTKWTGFGGNKVLQDIAREAEMPSPERFCSSTLRGSIVEYVGDWRGHTKSVAGKL